jgi:hypothetical protein
MIIHVRKFGSTMGKRSVGPWVATALAVGVVMLMCVGTSAAQAPTSPVPRDDQPVLRASAFDAIKKLLPNPFKVRNRKK